MPIIRRGTSTLVADHAALQPVLRVVQSLHESPPDPESSLDTPLHEYAQATLFRAHLHLVHHSAVKLVKRPIVSSHGPPSVVQLPIQPHRPRLDSTVCIDPQTSRSIPTSQAATLDLHCLRAAGQHCVTGGVRRILLRINVAARRNIGAEKRLAGRGANKAASQPLGSRSTTTFDTIVVSLRRTRQPSPLLHLLLHL